MTRETSASLIAVTLILLIAGMGTACTVGPRAEETELATSPAGQEIIIEFVQRGAAPLSGELLAASDTALVVMVRTYAQAEVPYHHVATVAIADVKRFRFDGTLSWTDVTGEPPHIDARQMRLRARYPQGIDDALLERLLVAYGQDIHISYPSGAQSTSRAQ